MWEPLHNLFSFSVNLNCSKTIRCVKKKMKPEDIATSVYEPDPMRSCREDQQDDGKIQSEFASWRKRLCKNEGGTDAGPEMRGGSSARRRQGRVAWKKGQVAPEMSLKAWQEPG